MDILSRANNFFEDNEPEQAIKLLNNHMSNANDEEKAAMAELFIQWGFLEEAMIVLSELVEQNSNNHEFKVMLADLYIENNQDNDAILLLNEIPSDDDVYVQALLQLADLYQAQGLFEVAGDKLLEAKQILPNESIIDFALGELYFSDAEYKKAAIHYELINDEIMTEVSIVERLAESYAAVGEYEKALNYYSNLNSENPDTLFKYGFTAAQVNRNDIAINTWEKVLNKDPLYHSAYLELAKVYQQEGLIEEAHKTALKGLRVDEFNKELYYLAGTIAHQLNDDDESEKWINGAIALDNDFKEAVVFKISILKEKEDFIGIINLIRAIQDTGSNDPIYEWELARAYNETESYKESLNCYNAAYNNFKEDSDFLKEYGYFLIEEGQSDDGISILKMYLHYEPDDFEIKELTERFDQ